MVNRKHISSWAPCLSKRNDQITTTLAAKKLPNETWIQAIFQPKSTGNIEGVLCNLSLLSGGCFITNQGQKARKYEVKIEWTSRLRYTIPRRKAFQMLKRWKCGGKKRTASIFFWGSWQIMPPFCTTKSWIFQSTSASHCNKNKCCNFRKMIFNNNNQNTTNSVITITIVKKVLV